MKIRTTLLFCFYIFPLIESSVNTQILLFFSYNKISLFLSLFQNHHRQKDTLTFNLKRPKREDEHAHVEEVLGFFEGEEVLG